MGLHPRETLGDGQSAETEADERAVDDESTAVRPTFTPAVREASEQAGRALAEALDERQRQMRAIWDHDPAEGSAAHRDIQTDTEQMRQMMRRYQTLFTQLYQAV